MTPPSPGVSRSFFDLPATDKVDAEELAIFRSLSHEGSLDWDQLLKADRVLIVSEAGMGKTFECQQQQRRLWDAGEPTFFLELADLGPEDLATHFNPEERARFEQWQQAQTERAVFFLDSIDELKLTSRSFQGTLKRFATALGPHLGRACIVLTTRPGSDDRDAVQRHLRIPDLVPAAAAEDAFVDVAMRKQAPSASHDEPASRWRYVALTPLDTDQQEALARLKAVADPKALLVAIETEHVQEFAKRPLDFIELCEDWNASGQIRGHRDQIESDITTKLKPNPDRVEPAELSAQKAREGAERLALAALMTRKFAFWHGTDTGRGRGEGALDPAQVLTDWTPLEIRTLLERALFGFATYSRVRFHNRSVIEYLAAERLRGLVARGLAPRTLHRLLFVTTPVGLDLVRPTMQPVAAWLAPWFPSVMTRILQRDPSVLLRFGDPGVLDPAMRARALERYVAVYGTGGWRGLHVPALQARRLATPALAPTIQRLWAAGIENPEVRETLLDLIETGRLVANADIAYEVATDTRREARERLTALQAQGSIKDSRLPGLLDRMAARESGWTGTLAATAIVHLFPQWMSISQLLGTLAGLTFERGEVGGVSHYLPEAISRAELPPAPLETVRQAFTDLVLEGLHWDGAAYRIRTDRQDLVGALTRVCELQLRHRAPPEPLATSLALVLQMSRDDDYQDDATGTLRSQLAEASPALRRAVLQAQDALLVSAMTGKDVAERVMRLVWPPAMEIAFADAAWLEADLTDTTCSTPKRETALECLIHLAQQSDDRVAFLKALLPAVADVPELAARLTELVTAFEHPPTPPAWVAEHAKRTEERAHKEQEKREFWTGFFRSLIADTPEPLDQEAARNLAWRLTDVMSHAAHDSQYAGWNRGFLESVFGKDQVERLRQLIIGIWRTAKPTLPSERDDENKNTYYTIWRIGLTGLYAEAETPNWARRLDHDEAELAMRYAVTSMHGIPPWVDALALAHPEVVSDMLRPELMAQLNASGPQAQHSYLLQTIASGAPALLALMLEDVRTWVQKAIASGVGSLHEADKFERAIDLLLEHGDANDAAMIRAAASDHVRANAGPASVLFWLPLLIRLSPSDAVAEMERLAAAIPPAEKTEVTRWFAALFGHSADRGAVTTELQEDAALLARLTVLAYQHVRLQDDRPREGVHESGARDNAEFARNQLVGALFKTKGADAWREKLAFIDNPLVSHFRDRGLALATEAMAREWDAPNYSLADVAQIERAWDLPPVTRADMAALLTDRLDQLDDRLLEDSSPRAMWATIRQETVLRRAVAAVMEGFSKGAYSVGQEQVTAEEKETDVRLRSSGYDMEAVVELKIGENDYSYKDLSEALRVQLVGRYMAPEARRVGCLLISVATDRRWEHPDDGRLVGIEEIVALLQQEAQQLASALGYQSLLDVRVLDLRPRKLA